MDLADTDGQANNRPRRHRTEQHRNLLFSFDVRIEPKKGTHPAGALSFCNG
jgi:hypothetical protein